MNIKNSLMNDNYDDLLDNVKKLNKQYRRETINGTNNIHNIHYIHCNHLDKKINRLIRYRPNIEKNLFPSIYKENNNDYKNGYNNILKNISNPLFDVSKLPFNEYDWFKKIIKITENIPISISISSAKKKDFGFPLLYVNKQFEIITGYEKSEIIGKNCKFLQPDIPIKEEEIQYRIIKNSLKTATFVSVIITNIKKDKTPFHNLIILLPIIDKYANYLYVIGIQTEITVEPLNESDIQDVINLSNILCNVI